MNIKINCRYYNNGCGSCMHHDMEKKILWVFPWQPQCKLLPTTGHSPKFCELKDPDPNPRPNITPISQKSKCKTCNGKCQNGK